MKPAFTIDDIDVEKILQRGLTRLPFPHIVVDDFLPTELAERIVREYPSVVEDGRAKAENIRKGKLVYGGIHNIVMGETDSFQNRVLQGFLELDFVEFIRRLTKQEVLTGDREFFGGGFIETVRGGALDIHVDFNEKDGFHRVVNLLLYLNPGWKEEYGGSMEIWEGLQRCVKTVVPMLNRCLIFVCSEKSFHGYSKPVVCPEGMTRRTIASYYYGKRVPKGFKAHSTLYRRSSAFEK